MLPWSRPMAGTLHQAVIDSQALTGNEWLMSIRSRISIPGGTCEFDLPAYYAWQQHTAARRRLADSILAVYPKAEVIEHPNVQHNKVNIQADDPLDLHYKGHRKGTGSFVAVPESSSVTSCVQGWPSKRAPTSRR